MNPEEINLSDANKSSLPKKRSLFWSPGELIEHFSLTEKFFFYLATLTFGVSFLFMAITINNRFLVAVPANGGVLTEGIVGYPRYISPVLSYTSAGEDLSSLIYSGLIKIGPEGEIIPDLAENYSVSDDHLTYTFTIRQDAIFHDGAPVTADDVEFTIKKIIDPGIKSPERAKWEGVSVQKTNDKTITFTLKTPYAPFLENMTLGILPKHILNNVDAEQFAYSQFNSEPIGSGPYMIQSIKRDAAGLPMLYVLKAFDKFALGKPRIQNIIIKFYATEDAAVEALKNGEIESVSGISAPKIAALSLSKEYIYHAPLPRIFGIFFNQTQSKILADRKIRQALDSAVDRQKIVNGVLKGYGTALTGPLPPGISKETFLATSTEQSTASSTEKIRAARSLISGAGWKENAEGFFEKKAGDATTSLSFTISTSDAPELQATADLVKSQWEKIGVKVDIKIFEGGDFNQLVLRPRKYDALLFGEIVNSEADLNSFWDSGERNDPGLNIALYTNSKVDKALADMRTLEGEKKAEELLVFESEIAKDIPAVFLYSPDYIYVLPKKIKNFKMGKIGKPGERFANIEDWHINEEKVWKIFTK